MKITKRQLRKIIREEKIRLLVEQVDEELESEEADEAVDDVDVDENTEAFQDLVDAVQSAATTALESGLTKEEIATAVQGMIDKMG